MAKTNVFDSDPTVMAKATELKRELQRLVKTIVDDEDCNTETIDQAMETLSALKGLKLKRKSSSLSLKLSEKPVCPENLKCPLSKEMMRDPVILASGQTYDRPFIQKWLKAGNRTCPRSQQVLSHTLLTPNHLIREMISQWCKSQGIELLAPDHYVNDEAITNDERQHFQSLVAMMSASPIEQKEAAKEFRLLTKTRASYRTLFGEFSNAIPQLLRPLTEIKVEDEIYPGLQEDIITTLLNLSIHDNNKKLAAETNMVIPLLIDALVAGAIQTRTNAAATIFSLAALDSNKVLIGKYGAIRPLIKLLEEGHDLAMRDTASAIFTLCINHDNRVRAVRDGVVQVLIKKIMDNFFVDELLPILALVSSHQRAVEDMGEFGAVPCLLGIIRENGCERNKENAIAVLHAICFNDRTKWKEVREEENAHGTISKLIKEGTSRAKRKAQGIIDRLNKNVHFTSM